jgi:hypothetical protein
MDKASDTKLRDHLVTALEGRVAHMDLREVVAGFPKEAMNTPPPNSTATAWHLLEHIRFAQRDILDFMSDPGYEEPAWPDDFWPGPDERTNRAGWERTIGAIEKDLEELIDLIRDPNTDLLAPLAHAPGYTVMREALLIVDHTSYHLGELSMLRGVLDIRPASGWW